MPTASETLRSIFSMENDNYEEREDNKPEDGESVITDKGPDSDNGPQEQEVQSVQEDGSNVDEKFNEEHTDEDPASVEELEEESIPTDAEVEEMSEEIPETADEGDVVVDETGAPESVEPPTVEENPEVDEIVPEDAQNPVTEENPEGEVGVDPVQALEAILAREEGDIQIIKDGVQVCIDEENKVSIDNNDEGAGEGGEDNSEDTIEDNTSEGGEDNSEGSEGAGEGGEEGSEDASTEEMKLSQIAKFYC